MRENPINSVQGIERSKQGCEACLAASPEKAVQSGTSPPAGLAVQGQPPCRAGAAVERVERALEQPSRLPIISGDGHLQGYNQIGML